MAVSDDIADKLTSHQIGLQRLSSSTVRKFLAVISKADAKIVEAVIDVDLASLGRREQERLLKQIDRILDEAYEAASDELRKELEGLSAYEIEYQAKAIEASIPIDLGIAEPSPDQVWASVNARPFQGRYLRDWYGKLADDAKVRVRGVIRTGVTDQRTIDQIVRDLRGTKANGYKDGAISIDKRNAEAVVRTSVNHTATVAREQVYKRNRRLIKGVQMLATLDGRTSTRCRACDGAVAWNEGYGRGDFKRGTKFLKGIPSFTNESRPPFHYNCRTTTTPVLRSFAELGLSGPELTSATRASMNGQVAADQTYSQWLRKQPANYQDSVLGKSKGKLFRDGKLDLDRFVSRNGDELTLDQLKQQERTAWDKAFPSGE